MWLEALKAKVLQTRLGGRASRIAPGLGEVHVAACRSAAPELLACGGRRSAVCCVLVGVSGGQDALPGGFVDTCGSRGAVVPALSSERELCSVQRRAWERRESALQTVLVAPHSRLFALTSLPSCSQSPFQPYHSLPQFLKNDFAEK